MQRNQQGFSLLELMIVCAVVGILASIAYPSYQNHLQNTRRADAQGGLMGFANAMERYYTRNNTYVGAVAGTVFPAQWPLEGTVRYYNLAFTAAPTATAYTVLATPIAGTSQAGNGRLELDSTGARRWTTNDDGSGAVKTWLK